MDLLTRLEGELLAQLQGLPAHHFLKQPGRQPVYANELQKTLSDEGLVPVQGSFLAPLLKRLPPRGLDTCLDVPRWLGENEAILAASSPPTPAASSRGRSRFSGPNDRDGSGSPLERVKSKEGRNTVAQLLDVMQSAVPDLGSLFLMKDEDCTGEIGVTDLIEILTELNLADPSTLQLLKRAVSSSTDDGVVPYTKWLQDTARTSSASRRGRSRSASRERGGARGGSGKAGEPSKRDGEGEQTSSRDDIEGGARGPAEQEIDTSVVLEDAVVQRSESVTAPDPVEDDAAADDSGEGAEKGKDLDAADGGEESGGGDSGGGSGDDGEKKEEGEGAEGKEAGAAEVEAAKADGAAEDQKPAPSAPPEVAGGDAAQEPPAGASAAKKADDKPPEKKDAPQEKKPAAPPAAEEASGPPPIDVENAETDGQMTPSPALLHKNTPREESKTADAETQVASARQPANLIMTNSPKQAGRGEQSDNFTSGLFGIGGRSPGGGTRSSSQQPPVGGTGPLTASAVKLPQQPLLPRQRDLQDQPQQQIPPPPMMEQQNPVTSYREVADLLIQDAQDWRVSERFFRAVEVIDNTTVYTEAVCVDEPVSEQRIDDFVRLRKMRKISAAVTAGGSSFGAGGGAASSSTGFGGFASGGGFGSSGGFFGQRSLVPRHEEDDGSPRTKFTRNEVPNARTVGWVPPSMYEPVVGHFEDHFANTTTACGVALSKHRVHWTSASELILREKNPGIMTPAGAPGGFFAGAAAGGGVGSTYFQDGANLNATIKEERLPPQAVVQGSGVLVSASPASVFEAAQPEQVAAATSGREPQAQQQQAREPLPDLSERIPDPVGDSDPYNSAAPPAPLVEGSHQAVMHMRVQNVDPQTYCVGHEAQMPQMQAVGAPSYFNNSFPGAGGNVMPYTSSAAALAYVVPPRLFSALQPSDVEQGLGDSSFVQGIRVVCEKCPELVVRCFGGVRDSVAGANGPYVVYLFHPQKNFCREEVVVNDLVPCIHGYPLFSTNRGGELWSMILEKAVAKLLGGYHNLNGVGIPLLWNMLAGLQFEEGEFPPFRSLYTWRPQRVIYNELPDTATSNLTLWGEGTFLRDLASYRYSEPAANCLTSRNVLEYLGGICADGHLLCATFVPDNPYEIEFGTYATILRVDVNTQLAWFRGFVHPDAAFGEPFRDRFETELEKTSERFTSDRAQRKKQADTERKLQAAKDKLLASIGKKPKKATSRKSAPAVMSPTARKRLEALKKQQEELAAKRNAEGGSSASEEVFLEDRAPSSRAGGSSAGSVSGSGSASARSSIMSSASSSAAGSSSSRGGAGNTTENALKALGHTSLDDPPKEPPLPASDDFTDPNNPFSFHAEEVAKGRQSTGLLKQTVQQLALADRKKFCVSFSDFEKFVYDVQYCEIADLVYGTRQPQDWKEQAVFNTIRGIFTHMGGGRTTGPGSGPVTPTASGGGAAVRGRSATPPPRIRQESQLRAMTENTCYEVWKSLVRMEFEEFGIDQVRFYVLANRWNPRLSEKDLASLWRDCDLDRDNFLSYPEFYRLFELAKQFCRVDFEL